ncbi:DNA-binding transcriptional response regulator [Rhodanobacter hydrolyticus]|uniref:Histidine kinase n=1 Tax=Rhodanobacter hydrolyticus TaxID=2250595 RepID=A0ABW8J940_9GAMM
MAHDMARALRVLLIEDEQKNIELWEDAVAAHNAEATEHGFSIETTVAMSVDKAISCLKGGRFDAAVVDLRLKNSEGPIGPNDDGNQLVKRILTEQPMGVVVYTGQKAEVADFGCPQVVVIDRGDGLSPVMSWLKDQSQLLFHLRSVMEAFDAEAAKVFFKSIWPRWRQWTKDIGDASVLSKLVARHVIAHAHDSMLYEGGEQVHPEETYFAPPMKPRLDTGDLLETDGEVWIVVTPRCDMAHDGKVQSILLARCSDISKKWNELEQSESKGAKSEISKIAQHEGKPKQHFLPRLSDHVGSKRGPWLAQFHDIKVVDAKQAQLELPARRFASLAPQFIPSLTGRFGSYFSRIGTPDFSSD